MVRAPPVGRAEHRIESWVVSHAGWPLLLEIVYALMDTSHRPPLSLEYPPRPLFDAVPQESRQVYVAAGMRICNPVRKVTKTHRMQAGTATGSPGRTVYYGLYYGFFGLKTLCTSESVLFYVYL